MSTTCLHRVQTVKVWVTIASVSSFLQDILKSGFQSEPIFLRLIVPMHYDIYDLAFEQQPLRQQRHFHNHSLQQLPHRHCVWQHCSAITPYSICPGELLPKEESGWTLDVGVPSLSKYYGRPQVPLSTDLSCTGTDFLLRCGKLLQGSIVSQKEPCS